MRIHLRSIYAVVFSLLLFIEICIALFVKDTVIRPYVGDVLATVLVCCFCRVIFPKGVRALPLYVFIFATVVEIGQYFDFVRLLGLDGNRFLSVLIGRTFSLFDVLCYAIGCLAFWAVDRVIQVRKHNRS